MDPVSSYTKFRATKFFASLDGLRALSIIGVIWFHCWWGTPYYPILKSLPVLRQGEIGVQIFYVLSGFLITTLLLRERERFGTISLRDFYFRRALRIWPMYYATFLVYVFVVLKFEHDPSRVRNFFHYVPSFLTFTYTWFITPRFPSGIFNFSSTLATEEQFYFFWPLIMKFARGIWPVVMMATLICVPVAAYAGWFSGWIPWDSFWNRVLINISIPIGLGAILAHVLHHERAFQLAHRLLGKKWVSSVALCLLALSLAPEMPNRWLALGAILLLVGASVIREDHWLAPVLKFSPLAYIGMISYGMYLLNSLSVHLASATLNWMGVRHPVLIFPVGVGIAAGVASISYRYYEKPFLALKDKKFGRNSKTQTADQPREANTDPVINKI